MNSLKQTFVKTIDRYHHMAPAAKTSIWFTICNFLQRGTAIITVPIFTRLLTQKQYGVFNVYLSWFEIFVLITSLKLPYEGLNNGLIRHEEDKDGYASSICGLMIVMTLFWSGIYLLFRRFIDGLTGFSSLIMLFMFVELMFNPPLYLWTNRERFDFRYKKPVIVTMVSTLVNPAIAILAVLLSSYKAEARIISMSVTQSIFGLALLVIMLRKGKTFYKKEYWRFALSFNLPLVFFYMSHSLLNQADRIMINFYSGSGDAGIYSVAYSAATLVQIFVTAINGSFNPWMYKKLKSQIYPDIRRIATMLLLLVAAATTAMTILAPDLIHILATPEYAEAIWVIPPVSASVFFIFLYMIFANVEMYYGDNHYIALVSILASLANMGLNAIFIPRFGYLAAGWTTVVSYMLLAFMHWVCLRKTLRAHSIPKDLFDIKAILIVVMVEMTFVFVMLWVYTLGIFRYGVIIIGMVIAFLLRDRILGLWKMIKAK